MSAVERAGVDFLVARLDNANVLAALSLGAHLAACECGRQLQGVCGAYIARQFQQGG